MPFMSVLRVEKVSEASDLGPAVWMLTQPLIFETMAGQRITVPAGFATDFASVPRLPGAFLLTGDSAHASATVHDYMLVNGAPWRLAADTFREAMRAEGVPRWRAWLMYWAVRFAEPDYVGDPADGGAP